MGKKFAAYGAQGNIVTYYDDIDSPVPAGVTDVIEITEEQWQTCIGTPGYTVQNGALVAPVPPTAAQQLATAQAAQITTLSAACKAAIYAGFSSSALGTPHTYPAKDTDQQNLSASVLASMYSNLPADWTTRFWCADSTGNWSLAPHTAAQIQQAGIDGKTAIENAIARNTTLAAQVMAATTLEAVQAIVWS